MKKLKVKYVDFWKGFNPDDFYLHVILKEKYEVVFSDDPDILIYSCFGKKNRKYKCLKIFYTGENIVPNFNECDYAIGFHYISFEDRYIRFPNYLMERKYFENLKNIDNFKREDIPEKFCIMINSNPAAKTRISFFEELSKYKKVDSGGKTKNNLGYRIKNKIEESKKYKFSIAFENSKSSGYCTEKITDAFAAGTIPIYYGDPRVFSIFHKDSFVYLDDLKNIDKVIDLIKKIDNDDSLYKKYINHKKLIDDKYIKNEQLKLKQFIYNIVENKKVFYKNEQNHLIRFLKKTFLHINNMVE